MSQLANERVRLGGLTRRGRPGGGGRPVIRFVIALMLTTLYTLGCIWLSAPWRSDLEEALGPIMAWVIPTMLGYIPGVLIGFIMFTLLILRYRVPSPEAPRGPWPDGEWPVVTIIVAAYNEEESIERTLENIGAVTYPGRLEVVLADNNSTDRTAELAEATAERLRAGLPARVRA